MDVCVQGTDGNISLSVVWAGFHYGGNSELSVMDDTMNHQVYRPMLQQSLSPWARTSFQNNFVLVQHNEDPWDQIEVHIRDMDEPPTTPAQLRVDMQQAWIALGPVKIGDLVRSIPHRVRAVLASCGGHTHINPNLYDAIDPFYRLTKFEKCSMSALFATDIIFWYNLPWHPLTQLHSVVLMSAHHMVTSNITRKLKSRIDNIW